MVTEAMGMAAFTPEQVRAFQNLMLDARRARGLTQTEAANEIGVSQTLISSLERGPSNGMRIRELFSVLSYYGIEPNVVAEVLGYYGGPAGEHDPKTTHALSLLHSIPESVYDDILRALELMVRGSQSR